MRTNNQLDTLQTYTDDNSSDEFFLQRVIKDSREKNLQKHTD